MLSREKNKISYVHFILGIFVILIHSINNRTPLQRFFSIESGIGQFAVPLFFLLSGFLFFQNVKVIDDIPKKISNRIKTVFYPYMFWNAIYYLIHHILKPTDYFSITEFVDAVLSYTYNPAFWFMFQLILLIAITPIVFYATRKYWGFISFFLLISFTIVFDFDIPFINEDAIIYFIVGAMFAKFYIDGNAFLIEKKAILVWLLISIFAFLLNRIAYAYVSKSLAFIGAFTLSVVYVRLTCAFFLFYLCDLFFRYNKVPHFMNNTFFLYAMHYMIVKAMIIIMNYVKYKFLEPDLWVSIETVVFILSPFVCVFFCYFLSKFLSKAFPKLYSVITGYRK